MLDHFCEFICGPDFCLTGSKTCEGLVDIFPYDRPPTSEDDEYDHWAVFEHFQVCVLFCCALQLLSPVGFRISRQFMMGGKHYRGGVNVGLFVVVKRMTNLVMWLSCLCIGERSANIWSGINMLEGVEFCFNIFCTRVVVIR